MRQTVAEAWLKGTAAGRRDRDNFRTDGRTVYSYNHPIGRTIDGQHVVYECRYSVTTRGHVGAIRRVADRIEPVCPCTSGRCERE